MVKKDGTWIQTRHRFDARMPLVDSKVSLNGAGPGIVQKIVLITVYSHLIPRLSLHVANGMYPDVRRRGQLDMRPSRLLCTSRGMETFFFVPR
jgi:hypothetical protein